MMHAGPHRLQRYRLFIDIEWAKLNNILMHPLTKLIPVYNINGSANDASMITDIADVILRYENHLEHTQLAVTHLGKQSLVVQSQPGEQLADKGHQNVLVPTTMFNLLS
jgi:hypothetical protein